MDGSDPRRAPRVLHVGRVGFVGGVERVMVTLASARAEGGSSVTAPGGGALERLVREHGVAFLASPVERSAIAGGWRALAYPRRWAAASRAIDAACARLEPDLIHAHHPATVLQAAYASRRRRLPILFHVHEIGPPKPLYALALRAALRLSARVICVSRAGLALVRGARVPARCEARVVHNGVDEAFASRSEATRPADLGPGGPHVGVFAALEPRKGQDVLLEAAAAVRSRCPEARFWLVGPDALADKARYVARLRERAAALGEAVRLTGYREDVVGLMKAMDVVALPSVAHESLSMVLLEALTLGRPVVASDVGGSAEAVIHERTGLVVPPGDASALARAIGRLAGPEGRAFGERARADAAARFSTERFVGEVEALYGAMMGSRGRA